MSSNRSSVGSWTPPQQTPSSPPSGWTPGPSRTPSTRTPSARTPSSRTPSAPSRRMGSGARALRRQGSDASVTGPRRDPVPRRLDFGPQSPRTPPQSRNSGRRSYDSDSDSEDKIIKHMKALKMHLDEVEREVKILKNLLKK